MSNNAMGEPEYEEWLIKLQSLTHKYIDPDKWISRWYDGYSPQEALEVGPE